MFFWKFWQNQKKMPLKSSQYVLFDWTFLGLRRYDQTVIQSHQIYVSCCSRTAILKKFAGCIEVLCKLSRFCWFSAFSFHKFGRLVMPFIFSSSDSNCGQSYGCETVVFYCPTFPTLNHNAKDFFCSPFYLSWLLCLITVCGLFSDCSFGSWSL